ncbi:unnamed protein product, partial [Ilex paraguariensis]
MEISVPNRLVNHSFSSSPLSSQPLKTGVRFLQPNLIPTRLNRSKPSTPIGIGAQRTMIPSASNNGSPTISNLVDSVGGGRIGEVKRVTKETNVSVKIDLDGSGVADSSTGIPFLDHMLDQLASHGLFNVHVKATGDIHIDDHHTNEDVALAIGTALLQALGDRKGINRFGDFSAPLDEALIHVSL